YVQREVLRAVNSDTRFFPLLLGVSYGELQRRRPEWEDAIAGVVATSIPSEASEVVPRIVAGLKRLGIQPRDPERTPSSGSRDDPSTRGRAPTSSAGEGESTKGPAEPLAGLLAPDPALEKTGIPTLAHPPPKEKPPRFPRVEEQEV